MNPAEFISTAARPMWLRVLPYGLAVLAVGAVLYGAYRHGVTTTATDYQGRIDRMVADNQRQLAEYEAAARERERQHTQAMADIDQQHQKEIADEKAAHDRIVADLRAGTISLRKRFTCPAGNTAVPSTGTSTGQRDATEAGGLQGADVEFLLREADRADEVTRQLQACQAVVRKDRGL